MPPAPKWSNRIVILAVLGVFFFTLLPFYFDFPVKLPAGRSPFLLAGWGKNPAGFDAFLNVLLFVPFGFGISEKFTEKGKSRAATLTWALALGALLSYSVEFLQIYVPSRDSGWGDIFPNTSGSLVGFLLFELCGMAILRALSKSETALGNLLRSQRAAAIVAAYFALWIVISIPLQMQTRFDNWARSPLLWVGKSDADEYGSAWEGEVFGLQIWNRPLDQATVRELGAANPRLVPPGLLAAYDFSGQPPWRDQMNSLPELALGSDGEGLHAQADAATANVSFDGKSWLVSRTPVPNLVQELQKTNQLAIRVVCRPRTTTGMTAAIVSLSQKSGTADLELVQKDEDLIFVLRNSISTNRHLLSWRIDNVFTDHRTHDVVFSYDGTTASFYLDGRSTTHPYRLGPGAALATGFRHVKTSELDGYGYVYYFLMFFSGGALAGIAARSFNRQSSIAFRLVVFVMPALALEAILVIVSGRSFSVALVTLCTVLAIGGSRWVNADRAGEKSATRRQMDKLTSKSAPELS
jgi:VanZ family protein